MGLIRKTTENGEVFFVDAKTGNRVDVDERYTGSKNSTSSETKSNTLYLGKTSITLLRALGFIIGLFCFVVGIMVIRLNVGVSEEAGTMIVITGIFIIVLGFTTSILYYVIAGIGDTVLKLLRDYQKSNNN